MTIRMNDRWKRLIGLAKEGAPIHEIAKAEGCTERAIQVGFSMLRKQGYAAPRFGRKGQRPLNCRLSPDVDEAVTKVADETGRPRSDVVHSVLRAAFIEHPQIALNLLDPEA